MIQQSIGFSTELLIDLSWRAGDVISGRYVGLTRGDSEMEEARHGAREMERREGVFGPLCTRLFVHLEFLIAIRGL